MEPIRSLYLRTLKDAMARPLRGDARVALQSFLTLNAAYFLGEWLPPDNHARLMRRVATEVAGIEGLHPPDEEVPATQLAQHACELAAAFGATAWTDRMITLTEHLVPAHQEDWAASTRRAIEAVAAGGDADRLLLIHARRRLWELTNPAGNPETGIQPPSWALDFVNRAAVDGDGTAIQVAEALLAEVASGVSATPAAAPAPRAPRPHGSARRASPGSRRRGT